MVDMHVHLEKGPYTKEWLDEFISFALDRGITKIGLLEHSHRFKEFRGIYDSIITDTDYGRYQEQWINKRSELHLQDYIDFINKMKSYEFPIEVEFGMEVCYFPNKELEIKRCLQQFDWDFVTGSIHWIDGWGFDHPKTKESWETKGVDLVYNQYFSLMNQLINSGLFHIVAHPDSIKCFNYKPNENMQTWYDKIAENLSLKGMSAEFNTGLKYRYGHSDLGVAEEFLKSLKKYYVNIVTASDAHSPEEVGTLIEEAVIRVENLGE